MKYKINYLYIQVESVCLYEYVKKSNKMNKYLVSHKFSF